MKRPLSPSHSPEGAVQLVEEASCPPSQPEQRMKREKKQQSFTLCEVCNIQLNSAAQAQIHYNGKSHQKRLKQLNKGKIPAGQGRSPPSRSRLPKGCPCSGTAAPLGSWKLWRRLVLSLAGSAGLSVLKSFWGPRGQTAQQRDGQMWVCPSATAWLLLLCLCGCLLELCRWFVQQGHACPRLSGVGIQDAALQPARVPPGSCCALLLYLC